VLVLLMVGFDNLRWNAVRITFHDEQFRHSSNIKVIA
jgi:hypothetical protein